MAESKMTDLIAKLEAATEGSRELDALIWIATDPKPLGNIKHWVHEWAPGWRLGDVEGSIYMRDHPTGSDWPAPEFTTSLDAIVALIERKLPGWGGMVSFGALTCGATLHTADLWGPVTETGETEDGIETQLRPEEHGENRKPALAACIALLSSLQLQGGSEQ